MWLKIKCHIKTALLIRTFINITTIITVIFQTILSKQEFKTNKSTGQYFFLFVCRFSDHKRVTIKIFWIKERTAKKKLIFPSLWKEQERRFKENKPLTLSLAFLELLYRLAYLMIHWYHRGYHFRLLWAFWMLLRMTALMVKYNAFQPENIVCARRHTGEREWTIEKKKKHIRLIMGCTLNENL